MKLNQITYERKFSLGNYEMETISATATVEEGEKGADVMKALKTFVLTQSVPYMKAKEREAAEKAMNGGKI